MINISIFKDVVVFLEGGYTYQAIRKDDIWTMAAMEHGKVVEMHDITVRDDATEGTFMKAWWKAQRAAGTYTV